jgi:DNA-binding CsgD family transcriptional regulator
MATHRERERCLERLATLCRSSLDSEALRSEAIADLQRVIGFDRYCWPLADPRTLLPLDAIAAHDYGPGVPRALYIEYSGGDLAAKDELARRPRPATSFGVESGGDLAVSPRWDEVMRPVGIGDVAVAACRDGLGTWGWIEAYRDRGETLFSEDDLELLRRAAPGLGSALRRRVMAGGPPVAAPPRPPGVLILDPALEAVSATAGARAWLDAMPGAQVYAAFGILPAMFYPAAAVALAHGDRAGVGTLTRTVNGSWMAIEVAPLDGRHDGWVAVNLRTATAAETFDLLCRAFALSPRERQIVALLVAGLDTKGIERRLFISAYTVQDHLKSVFEKVGVHSRHELLARMSASGIRPEGDAVAPALA